MIDNYFINKYHSLPIAYFCMDSINGAVSAGNSKEEIYTFAHNHSEFEILYIEQGNAYMEIDGENYQLSSGDMLLINPFEVHFGKYPTENNHFSYFCIDFDIKLLSTPENEELLRSIEFSEVKYIHYIPKNHPQNHQLTTLIKNVYQAIVQKNIGWEYIVRGNMLLFLGTLISKNLEHNSLMDKKKVKGIKFMRESLSFIKAHFSEDITSRDAAMFFSYNLSYFCRLFKSVFNKSFNEYLLEYRLSKAKILLSSTNLTIAEICNRVGFKNQSYFSQVFKKTFGLLPITYRRNSLL